MTGDDMRYRVRIISGDTADDTNSADIENDADFEQLHVSHSEEDEEGDTDNELVGAIDRREKTNNLVYNRSDDEDGSSRAPLKRKKKEKTKKKKIDIFDMILEEGKENKSIDEEPSDLEMDTENFERRLAQLVDSDDSDNDRNQSTSKSKKNSNRKRIFIDNSDSDQEQPTQKSTDDGDFDSQAISKRLAKLVDSDNSDDDRMQKNNEKSVDIDTVSGGSNAKNRHPMRRAFLMESDDSENEENGSHVSAAHTNDTADVNSETGITNTDGNNESGSVIVAGDDDDNDNDIAKYNSNKKRERSASEESLNEEKSIAKKKRRKNVVIDDDDGENSEADG